MLTQQKNFQLEKSPFWRLNEGRRREGLSPCLSAPCERFHFESPPDGCAARQPPCFSVARYLCMAIPPAHTHTPPTPTPRADVAMRLSCCPIKNLKKKTLTRRIRRWVSLNRDEPRQKNDSCVCKCHTNPPERAGRRGGSPLEQKKKKKKKVCSFIRGGHSANLGVFSQQLKHTEKNYQSLKKKCCH